MPRIRSSTWVWLALFATWLLAGLWFAVPPAKATVLFAGGEDIDFTFVGGTFTTDTSAGNFRSGYARLDLSGSGGGGDPPSNYFLTPTFTSASTLWLSFYHVQSGTATSAGDQHVTLYSPDGVRRLMILGTGSGQTVKISKRNAAGTITDLVTCSASYPVASLGKLDWFVNYAVSGEVTLYWNGVQFCDFVGNVTTDSATQLNQANFSLVGSFNPEKFSEIIIATTDTRSLNLMTCAPQANGVNMTWTGSFANVNGTTANDATPLSTGSNNQTAEFTCPALPAGSFSVLGVQQVGRLLKGATGPANFRFVIRPSSGSTDYDSGSDIGLTTNFANYRFFRSLNPACSCAWTPADITTGVNQGVLSKP